MISGIRAVDPDSIEKNCEEAYQMFEGAVQSSTHDLYETVDNMQPRINLLVTQKAVLEGAQNRLMLTADRTKIVSSRYRHAFHFEKIIMAVSFTFIIYLLVHRPAPVGDIDLGAISAALTFGTFTASCIKDYFASSYNRAHERTLKIKEREKRYALAHRTCAMTLNFSRVMRDTVLKRARLTRGIKAKDPLTPGRYMRTRRRSVKVSISGAGEGGAAASKTLEKGYASDRSIIKDPVYPDERSTDYSELNDSDVYEMPQPTPPTQRRRGSREDSQSSSAKTERGDLWANARPYGMRQFTKSPLSLERKTPPSLGSSHDRSTPQTPFLRDPWAHVNTHRLNQRMDSSPEKSFQQSLSGRV